MNDFAAAQNWQRSQKLWERFVAADGSLAPEYDPTAPLHETYLEMGIYEQHSIPTVLVREDVDFEAIIEMARACQSLEEAHEKLRPFVEAVNRRTSSS